MLKCPNYSDRQGVDFVDSIIQTQRGISKCLNPNDSDRQGVDFAHIIQRGEFQVPV